MKFLGTLALLFAIGCGPNNKKPDTLPPGGGSGDAGVTTTTPDGAAGGAPCAQEVALECPEGQVDACTLTPPGETHACVTK